MVQIVIDPTTQKRLAGVAHVAQMCDESGQVIGYFVAPGNVFRLEPQVSEEELDRREREGGGRPLSDILADLRKRA